MMSALHNVVTGGSCTHLSSLRQTFLVSGTRISSGVDGERIVRCSSASGGRSGRKPRLNRGGSKLVPGSSDTEKKIVSGRNVSDIGASSRDNGINSVSNGNRRSSKEYSDATEKSRSEERRFQRSSASRKRQGRPSNINTNTVSNSLEVETPVAEVPSPYFASADYPEPNSVTKNSPPVSSEIGSRTSVKSSSWSKNGHRSASEYSAEPYPSATIGYSPYENDSTGENIAYTDNSYTDSSVGDWDTELGANHDWIETGYTIQSSDLAIEKSPAVNFSGGTNAALNQSDSGFGALDSLPYDSDEATTVRGDFSGPVNGSFAADEHPASEPLSPFGSAWSQSDVKEFESETSKELLRIKEILKLREQELVEVMAELELAKSTYEGLQSNAMSEISRVKEELSLQEVKLRESEKLLGSLKQVKIEYWGEGVRESVLIAGSFDGWRNQFALTADPASKIPNYDGLDGGAMMWEVALLLYPGVYQIKFIVDGKWTVDSRREVVTANMGQNNTLVVE